MSSGHDERHRSVQRQIGSKTHGGGPQYVDLCGQDNEPWPCSFAQIANQLAIAEARIAAALAIIDDKDSGGFVGPRVREALAGAEVAL